MLRTKQTFFNSETRNNDEKIFDGENRVEQVKIRGDDILVKMDSEEDAILVFDTLDFKNMRDETSIKIMKISNTELKLPFRMDSIRMLHSCHFISYETSSSMMSVYSKRELIKGIDDKLLADDFEETSISDTKKHSIF